MGGSCRDGRPPAGVLAARNAWTAGRNPERRARIALGGDESPLRAPLAATCRATHPVRAALLVVAVLASMFPGGAGAGVALPPGFTQQVYVSGQGFDRVEPGGAGVPVATSLGLDAAGQLYLARSGSRYGVGPSEEFLSHVYRIPPGGARLTPASEPRHVVGPPLRNPEVAAVAGPGELFLTTFDPERQVGVLYRVRDGHPVLFAGGTPPAGEAPLLRQPEGVAVDPAGAVYVADRGRDRVVKLDPNGRLLDPHYRGVTVPRARMLALDAGGALWIAGDGAAAAPWQEGEGQIWRLPPDGGARLVLEGPHAAAIAAGPGGALVVAERQGPRLYVLTADGRQAELGRFTDEALPRSLAFAPATDATRRAGLAGDLFLVTFALRTWYLNEVIRISGPFDELVRRAATPGRPAGPAVSP